jgi:hypothetical protein
VNTGERVHLNNVKWHFGMSMAKEVYSQIDEKLETTGSVLTRHAGGRKLCDRTVQDVNHTKIKTY